MPVKADADGSVRQIAFVNLVHADADEPATVRTDYSLRAYLMANMFDGEDYGETTVGIAGFLDDVCENVALWMVNSSGVTEAVERYFTGG